MTGSLRWRFGAWVSRLQHGRHGPLVGRLRRLFIKLAIALVIALVGARFLAGPSDHVVSLTFDTLSLRLSKKVQPMIDPDIVSSGVLALDLENVTTFVGGANAGPAVPANWTGSLVPVPGSEILPLENIVLLSQCDTVEVDVKPGSTPVLKFKPADGCKEALNARAILRRDVGFVAVGNAPSDAGVQAVRETFDAGVVAMTTAPWRMSLEGTKVAHLDILLPDPPTSASASSGEGAAGDPASTLHSIESLTGTLAATVDVESGWGSCQLERMHAVTLKKSNWSFRSVRFDDQARHLIVMASNETGSVGDACDDAKGPCAPPVCKALRRSVLERVVLFFVPVAIGLVLAM